MILTKAVPALLKAALLCMRAASVTTPSTRCRLTTKTLNTIRMSAASVAVVPSQTSKQVSMNMRARASQLYT